LYARLLGHCGDRRDAAELRKLAQRQVTASAPGTDGTLIGYVLLEPREGWAYVRRLAADQSKDFTPRYAALRAARFFHSSCPGVVPQGKLVAVVEALLGQPDITDLAVDELRRWRCWDFTGRILPIYTAATFNNPINRRAVLRYALQCPYPEARAFVGAVRKKDAEMIKDTEEMLRLEAAALKERQGRASQP
jgi:hypothetical protein